MWPPNDSVGPVDLSCPPVPNAFISGTGFYVPPRVVTNDDLIAMGIDTTNEWIVQRTGIEARRFAEEGVGTRGSRPATPRVDAIARAGIDAEGSRSHRLRHALSGAWLSRGAACFLQREARPVRRRRAQVRAARSTCATSARASSTASRRPPRLVKSGAAKHVLLVGAETHSAALDLTTRGRTVASLFGDGAGAVVVSATEEDRGIRGTWLGADGRFAETLCQKVFDITKRPFIPLDEKGVGQVDPSSMWAHMEGKVVFKHAVEKMCAALDAGLLDAQRRREGHRPLRLPPGQHAHQPVRRADRSASRRKSSSTTSSSYGNTTAATIPILLAEAEREGKLRRGMKVAMVAFGSGFTWGSSIVDW